MVSLPCARCSSGILASFGCSSMSFLVRMLGFRSASISYEHTAANEDALA